MKQVKQFIITLAVNKGFVETDDVTLIDLQNWLISIDESVWFGKKEGDWTWFADYDEYGLGYFDTPWDALEAGIISKLEDI